MKPKPPELFSHSCRCLNYNTAPIPSGNVRHTRSGWEQRSTEGWDDQSVEGDRCSSSGGIPEELILRKIRSRLQAIARATCNCETDHTEMSPRERNEGASDNRQGNACPTLRGAAKWKDSPLYSFLNARKRKTGCISKKENKANRKGRRSENVSFLDYALNSDLSLESAPTTDFTIRNSASCPCVKFYKAVMESPLPEVENSSSEISCESSSGSSDATQSTMEDVPSGSARPMTNNFISNSGSAGRWKRERLYSMRPRPRPPPYRFHDEYGWYRKPTSVASVLFPSCGPKPIDTATGKPRKSMPSHEKNAKSKQRNEKDVYPKEATTPVPKVSGNSIEEPNLEGLEELEDLPQPSGRCKPTFITMVKTAIRDLKPFKITTKEAISKYIHFRYKVKNDCLLKYILDWMIEMKILCKCSGHFFFTKKRLVKKTTVAVLPCPKRPCPKRRTASNPFKNCPRMKKRKPKTVSNPFKNCPKMNKRRPKNVCRRKKKVKEKKCTAECCYNVRNGNRSQGRRAAQKAVRQSCRKKKPSRIKKCCEETDTDVCAETESIRCRKIKPKRKKKKCCPVKKRKKPKKQVACTCNEELNSVKNRVKLTSRYIRRGGKIYKEERFI